MKVQFYAIAENEKGEIEQLLVTRGPGNEKTQEWTGVVYVDMPAAREGIRKENRALGFA